MKTYINPEIEMITFLTEDILTASNGGVGGTPMDANYNSEFIFS